MKNKPPVPVCTVFMTLRKFARDPHTENDALIGLVRAYWGDNYPAAMRMSFFIRCTSAHGNYPIEVQLQKLDGEVVWKGGPPDPWAMMDPLEMYDLQMNITPIFPAPGIYQFVLVIGGEEVSRQRFHAKLGRVPAQKAQE